MERKLKHHENKLLKKTDFLVWKKEQNLREIQILRRYHIQKREDYTKYNKIANIMKRLAHKLMLLDASDPYRIKMTDQLLEKTYAMGLIATKRSLSQIVDLTASAFCRRRLSVVIVRNKYCETLKQACTYIEQGHIRVGPNVVTDPAFLVTRNMEDFVTWTDTSKIRKKIQAYNDKFDDFDFLE
jgi:U3 small nucleolar ribonucleoprotein protein IMP3